MLGAATKYVLAIAAVTCLPFAVLAAPPSELSDKEKAKGEKAVADALAHLPQVSSDQPPLDVRRKVGEKFGECLAGKGWLHSAAVTFLLSGKVRDGAKLADADCLTAGFASERRDFVDSGFPVVVMRSLVADGLVRVDFRKAGPTDFSTVPLLNAASTVSDAAAVSSSAGSGSIAEKLGECAARMSPEGIRRLALTDAASADEMNQLRALIPTFSQCLPPGVTLNFAPGFLRDASVLAYARLAYTLAESRNGRHESG